MTFEPDQTVYLPDGREAIYVMQNGDQHLVRVVREVEGSHDEPPYSYPDDKITAAQKVYASAPVEVYDERIAARHATLLELDAEMIAKRQEIADAGRNKAAMEKAAAKYPCIQQALDFIEGRITHVVVHDYGGARIQTLKEAFEDVDTWGGRRDHQGMKLLNLFGTDKQGRSVAWGVNQYRDGSGSDHKQIWPATSEDAARAIVQKLLDEALEQWRADQRPSLSIGDTLDRNPWLEAPADWAAHIEAQKAEQRAAKIARLREEIAKMEAET